MCPFALVRNEVIHVVAVNTELPQRRQTVGKQPDTVLQNVA